MREVALISQTLRAGHCRAYFLQSGQDPTILTSNPSAFSEFELSESTKLITVNPPPELISPAHLARSRIFRGTLDRVRSGSKFGTWLERTVKRLVGVFRPVVRAQGANQSERAGEIDVESLRSSTIYVKLQEEHNSRPIDRLVVFDVFDLPVALAFAEEYAVGVLVR